MPKRLLSFIGLLIALGLLVSYFYNAYALFSKSYLVEESSLFKIDTFHLYTRAFTTSDGAGRNSKLKLTFESTNGYWFAIGGNFYEAIINRQKLEDTLMYHDLKFTIYSNKEVYRKYITSKVPIFVPVYQIQVGESEYINLAAMNIIARRKLLEGVIIPPAVVLFILFALYSKTSWTDRRRLLFAIVFILTLFGLALLILAA
jgi:hypothetical protein